MVSEENLLSDILNNSPSVELLKQRNREIIVLFLYKTFYRHREPVSYEVLRRNLVDYLTSANLENDEENDISVFDSYEEKAYKYIQRWTDKGFLRNYQEESGEVSDIIVDEQVIRLEVNHPYSAGWGEDYYLTSYDMRSPEPAYCVVQIVREPLKYVMLAGIIMMLVGGFLLFLEGPKRSDASSAEKQN